MVPRQTEAGTSSSINQNSTVVSQNYPNTTRTESIEDFPALDDLASSIADSPDFIMSTAGVNSPSPGSIVGSDTNGGTFPLTETPPPGYMSEDGDTQEPAELMSEKFVQIF